MNVSPKVALISALLLLPSCRSHAVADALESEQPEAAAIEAPPATVAGAAITYHRSEERGTRVYLPLTSPQCQADETANVSYLAKAIWSFDTVDGKWSALDIGTPDNWRIACNAMVDLVDIIGLDLEVGTYAVAATIDGELERGLVYVGPAMCNDVALGDAPAGQLALCVLTADGAEARFVPDPGQLAP